MSAVTAGREKITRFDIATRAALLSFSVNCALMVLKLTVGLMFRSIAVLGDGIDSAEDIVASGIALFTVRLALRPADEEHPYGHGKAESLSAVTQAALIAGGAVFIAVTATRRLVSNEVDIVVGPSLATMVVAAVVNLGAAAYSMRAARMSGSVAISADARHLLTNVVQAGAVIVALSLVGITGNNVFDPVVALVLAAYLTWTAFGIVRSALRELIDSSLPDEEIALVEGCLRSPRAGVRGFHELRTRKSGREKHIDVHVLVDPDLTVSEAHRLSDDLERQITEAVPGAVITLHVDPDEPDSDRGARPALLID